jgi:acetoin utilization protein AcuC
MSESVRVIWDEQLARYDFGHDHPMTPVRVVLTMALARELGVLDHPNVTVEGCEAADDKLLELVHTPEYVDAVKRVGDHPFDVMDLRFGLGSPDNPIFAQMHDASALVVGATVAAARAVHEGRADHAVNIAGGLHHAMPGAASGFCVYNDVAVAIRWLLDQGVERVGYVDVDVHHGDGVQAVFFDEPRVLTISIHETGNTLFPGTGFCDETGGPHAEGTAVNIALPPGTGDQGWLRAFDAVVPPLLREWRPQVLVTQHGCDSHVLDPLAHLTLTVDGQRLAYAALHRLAHETAGGNWVATGGGGYDVVQVVPRAWTHLIAEAAGHPVEPATPTPGGWREYVRMHVNEIAPLRMTDGRHPSFRSWESGFDPGDAVDRAVMATRNAVFPSHGLDPML